MVVVMAPEATSADVEAVVRLVRSAGGEAFVSRGLSRTIVGLVGDVADSRRRPGTPSTSVRYRWPSDFRICR